MLSMEDDMVMVVRGIDKLCVVSFEEVALMPAAAALLLSDIFHNARCRSCFIKTPSFLQGGGNGDIDGNDEDNMSLFALCCCY